MAILSRVLAKLIREQTPRKANEVSNVCLPQSAKLRMSFASKMVVSCPSVCLNAYMHLSIILYVFFCSSIYLLVCPTVFKRD